MPACQKGTFLSLAKPLNLFPFVILWVVECLQTFVEGIAVLATTVKPMRTYMHSAGL